MEVFKTNLTTSTSNAVLNYKRFLETLFDTFTDFINIGSCQIEDLNGYYIKCFGDDSVIIALGASSNDEYGRLCYMFFFEDTAGEFKILNKTYSRKSNGYISASKFNLSNTVFEIEVISISERLKVVRLKNDNSFLYIFLGKLVEILTDEYIFLLDNGSGSIIKRRSIFKQNGNYAGQVSLTTNTEINATNYYVGAEKFYSSSEYNLCLEGAKIYEVIKNNSQFVLDFGTKIKIDGAILVSLGDGYYITET